MIAAAVAFGLHVVRTGRNIIHEALRAERLYTIRCAIGRYTDKHGGKYPDSFSSLLDAGLVAPALLASDDNGGTPASGATTREVVDHIAKPGHLSYVYLGAGLTDKTVADDDVVAYEIPSAGTGQTSVVRLGAERVELLDPSQTAATPPAVSATTRPVHFTIPPRQTP